MSKHLAKPEWPPVVMRTETGWPEWVERLIMWGVIAPLVLGLAGFAFWLMWWVLTGGCE